MAHCIVPSAEEILDKEFPVLDKGFVRLVDYLGSDERIVQAARVSYGKGTKTFREDRGLIFYLLRNEHTSPFEQVVLTFHIKLPIFVARQWIRHRTARVNEISGRYSVLKDEFYLPALEDLAAQSKDNKQGRAPEPFPMEVGEDILQRVRALQGEAYKVYEELLGTGLAREVARIVLPLCAYTEWYWQMDLHNLMHFLKLRMDPHAQKEIRLYAQVIFEITKRVCPIAMEAFEEYVLKGVTFSGKEMQALHALMQGFESQGKISEEEWRKIAAVSGLEEKELERFKGKVLE
ncbi:MAG: FAD-dependent thymidylate synthase [Spirochaetes bacterium]|nr:FAD-dependent thymidylate synthase [Spirochaetota bacterium]